MGYFVLQTSLSARAVSSSHFSVSNSTSSAVMRMIFRRYQMLRRGIHPQRAASTRCFSPSWTEVRYTRIMPFQKTMASATTTSRIPNQANQANNQFSSPYLPPRF